MHKNSIFHGVRAYRPGRSVFDLSYSKLTTCDMGQLIPVMADEAYPGDIFEISAEMVLRMMPLVSPVMHPIFATIHYFFVPNRIVFDDWEKFITGGIDGDDETVLPRWEPTDTTVGSLWDYFGFPPGIDPADAYPVDFPKRAYNKIWNEYYRDETLMDEVDIETSEEVLLRCWTKDYFASALPWQQRGTAPALPISGTLQAEWPVVSTSNNATMSGNSVTGAPGSTATKLILETNEIDASGLTTFDVSDLRLAFQIQKWMERNARAGARYTEEIWAHFGVHTGDDRLQRPEYIGGAKFPIIVSEVLQTSSTDAVSPQGNLAGHGITAGRNFCGKYYVKEHGWFIGVLSIMPVPMYCQGIDRQFLRRTRYDYMWPEFVGLSEQAIERAEIYASAVDTENRTIFGYQGRFDELRTKRNMICGLMRTDFDYWHLARIFDSAPELNATFLEMDSVTDGGSNPYKRIFAAPSEPGFIVTVGNRITAVRPIPAQAEPGLIDHY